MDGWAPPCVPSRRESGRAPSCMHVPPTCSGKCSTSSAVRWTAELVSPAASLLNATSSAFQSVCCTVLTSSSVVAFTVLLMTLAMPHKLPSPDVAASLRKTQRKKVAGYLASADGAACGALLPRCRASLVVLGLQRN